MNLPALNISYNGIMHICSFVSDLFHLAQCPSPCPWHSLDCFRRNGRLDSRPRLDHSFQPYFLVQGINSSFLEETKATHRNKKVVAFFRSYENQ